MIETIIRAVVGTPLREGEPLYYSVPGPLVDAEANLIYHEKTVQGILRKLGYAPKPINEGLAVIFSELADQRFTGIGLSFGGGMVNVCFAFRSIPILTFSLATAGDWIDEKAALAVGEKPSLICSIKESTLDLSKGSEPSKIEFALSVCYDKLIAYVLENLRKEVAKTIKMPRLPEPVTIILGGGAASPKGFAERFTQALRDSSFPLEVGEVKMAKDPLSCVALGALVVAQAEEAGKKESKPWLVSRTQQEQQEETEQVVA
jgi:hypothetical protein